MEPELLEKMNDNGTRPLMTFSGVKTSSILHIMFNQDMLYPPRGVPGRQANDSGGRSLQVNQDWYNLVFNLTYLPEVGKPIDCFFPGTNFTPNLTSNETCEAIMLLHGPRQIEINLSLGNDSLVSRSYSLDRLRLTILDKTMFRSAKDLSPAEIWGTDGNTTFFEIQEINRDFEIAKKIEQAAMIIITSFVVLLSSNFAIGKLFALSLFFILGAIRAFMILMVMSLVNVHLPFTAFVFRNFMLTLGGIDFFFNFGEFLGNIFDLEYSPPLNKNFEMLGF